MDVHGLLATLKDVFVESIINILNLVTAEDNGLDRPIAMLDVVNFGGGGRDNSEVVAGALHAPPQV